MRNNGLCLCSNNKLVVIEDDVSSLFNVFDLDLFGLSIDGRGLMPGKDINIMHIFKIKGLSDEQLFRILDDISNEIRRTAACIRNVLHLLPQ